MLDGASETYIALQIICGDAGKSGIIARKIAATFSSTGTPALFVHPAEAVHGDLGAIVGGDVVVALSYSGETEEVVRLLEPIKRLGLRLISMTGAPAFAAPVRSANAGCMSGSWVMKESSATATVSGMAGMILPRNVFHS